MTGVANWLASSLIYGRSSFWPMTTNHCRPIVAIRPLSVSLSLFLCLSRRLDLARPVTFVLIGRSLHSRSPLNRDVAFLSPSTLQRPLVLGLVLLFPFFLLTATLRVWRRRLGTGHRPNVTVGAGLSFVESLLINMHHLLLLLLLLLMLLASHPYLVFPFH